MSGKNFEIRYTNFMKNALLDRRQMSIEVIHPGLANVSKKTLRDTIAAKYNIKNPETIVVYGMRNAFGGGRSNGFAFIYDTKEALLTKEPNHRLVRLGFVKKTAKKSRKSIKELKNRKKKVRGTKKNTIGVVKK